MRTEAYDEMNWSRVNIMETAEQCKRELISPFYASEPGEGCQVTGKLVVNKVAGNFHIG